MQVYAQHQNKKVSLCTKESIKGQKEGVTLRHSFLYGVEVFKIETLPMYPSGAARQILTWFFYLFYKYTKEILSSCTRLCISTNQDWSRIIS